jgi:hypothetical protein
MELARGRGHYTEQLKQSRQKLVSWTLQECSDWCSSYFLITLACFVTIQDAWLHEIHFVRRLRLITFVRIRQEYCR